MTSGRYDIAPELPAGRRAVLYAVRRRGEATVEQVAEQLGITVSGARQHLAALTAAGYVDVAEVPVEGDGAFLDIDTPQALDAARGG